jgi:putative restriction endonuclease
MAKKKKPPRILWSRDQLLVAFGLYCWTPFGRLHLRNPDIIRAARGIGRTPSALALMTVNFASLDPAHRARGVKGMSNASDADRALWAEFEQNSEAVAAEAEAAWERLVGSTNEVSPADGVQRLPPFARGGQGEAGQLVGELEAPSGPTEIERTVRARRVQRFFRDAVLASYDFHCALTGLAIPELLTASHIIPWSQSVERRADPRNGIALNALHDRAFDRGLITFDEHFRVVVSTRLQSKDIGPWYEKALQEIAGESLMLPERFRPDPDAITWHRESVFRP